MSKGQEKSVRQRVAKDIAAAVDGGRDVLYTPAFWIMLVVRSLPRPLFHRTKL